MIRHFRLTPAGRERLADPDFAHVPDHVETASHADALIYYQRQGVLLDPLDIVQEHEGVLA